jgi:hypothetical protein
MLSNDRRAICSSRLTTATIDSIQRTRAHLLDADCLNYFLRCARMASHGALSTARDRVSNAVAVALETMYRLPASLQKRRGAHLVAALGFQGAQLFSRCDLVCPMTFVLVDLCTMCQCSSNLEACLALTRNRPCDATRKLVPPLNSTRILSDGKLVAVRGCFPTYARNTDVCWTNRSSVREGSAGGRRPRVGFRECQFAAGLALLGSAPCTCF